MILFQDRIKQKFICEILLRLSFMNYIVGNFFIFCPYSLLLASYLPTQLLFSCLLLFIAGRFSFLGSSYSEKLLLTNLFYLYFQITFGKLSCRIVENFTKATEVLPTIIRRNMLKKVAQVAKIALPAKQLRIPSYQNQK